MELSLPRKSRLFQGFGDRERRCHRGEYLLFGDGPQGRVYSAGGD